MMITLKYWKKTWFLHSKSWEKRSFSCMIEIHVILLRQQRKYNVNVFDWPSTSLVLNSVERLWNVFKIFIKKAEKHLNKKIENWYTLLKWINMPVNVCANLVSLSREEVIKLKAVTLNIDFKWLLPLSFIYFSTILKSARNIFCYRRGNLGSAFRVEIPAEVVAFTFAPDTLVNVWIHIFLGLIVEYQYPVQKNHNSQFKTGWVWDKRFHLLKTYFLWKP